LAKISIFGENGLKRKILFSRPKKAHLCAKRRHLT